MRLRQKLKVSGRRSFKASGRVRAYLRQCETEATSALKVLAATSALKVKLLVC